MNIPATFHSCGIEPAPDDLGFRAFVKATISETGQTITTWEDTFPSLKAASFELYNKVGELP